MSLPIVQCMVDRAARGNEIVYQDLLNRFKTMLKKGHILILACRHKPPCEPAIDEQIEALYARIEADMAEAATDEVLKELRSIDPAREIN